MCNAWNHYDGCTCGFGGDGHLGGGHGGGSGTGTYPIFFDFGPSLLDLAAELGYSVCFPTICRYCGNLIYLFASPEGGFAIFDSLGIPWPKHECWGIHRDATNYTSLSLVCSPSYRFPIPKHTNLFSRKTGRVKGVVVFKKDQHSFPGLSKFFIYDGRALFEIYASSSIEIGHFVEGELELRSGHSFLNRPVYFPEEAVAKELNKREKIASKIVRQANVWKLQSDIQILKTTSSDEGSVLEAALDALVSGYPLVSTLLLLKIVCQKSDAVSNELKARWSETLVNLLQDLNLFSAIPNVWNLLSKGTKNALSEEATKSFGKSRQLGELKLKKETREKRTDLFSNRWKKEHVYASALSKKSDLKIDLHALAANFSSKL